MTRQKELQGQVTRRTTRDLSPFGEMDHLFDRLFEGGFLRPFEWRRPELTGWRHLDERLPRVDVIDRDEEVLVRAEVPGLKKEELEVTISDDLVTIRGETREEREEKGEVYRSEIRRGAFTRTVRLPTEVKAEGAKAHFEDGLLEVTLPKAREASRHTVTIE
jgi:HSP20 family protein